MAKYARNSFCLTELRAYGLFSCYDAVDGGPAIVLYGKQAFPLAAINYKFISFVGLVHILHLNCLYRMLHKIFNRNLVQQVPDIRDIIGMVTVINIRRTGTNLFQKFSWNELFS